MKHRILVIDDDPSMLHLVRSVLEANGYDCLTTSRVEDAFAELRSTPGILVAISDINMPGMDGITFLRQISSRNSFSSVPRVIFLTGHPQIEYAVAALRLGAVDFLSKPIRSQELLRAVGAAIERAQREREVQQLPAQAETLARQVEELAAALKVWRSPSANHALAPAAQLSQSAGAAGAKVGAASRTDLANSAKLAMQGLDHLRRPPRSFAPLGELDDVAWDLLIQLLRAERGGHRLSVSALSISVEHVSQTTALRRIQELAKVGHIERHPDPADARRDFVVLAAETKAALDRYLQHVAKELAAAASSQQ